MPEQHDIPTTGWVLAWADLQERPAEAASHGFAVGTGAEQSSESREYITGWPGPGTEELAAKAAAEGIRLTLVTAESGAADGPAPGGLTPVSERVLLMAPTAELSAGVELPENAQVALAPMETFDAVEITLFDRPVARGRIQVRDDFAAVAIRELPEGPEKETLERALFAAMAEEAFIHGAEYLHMVVGQEAAASYEASGWTAAARLVSFEKI
ncbi:hypothetical protein [Pseudarthrobacter enclensis]|uniref:GNAT family acetyltransferase n=1 Tax=Pseudarthrobacter enclensis TaxID=993070 RepID=A0ABT9RYN8_9MICC|nr:hypothetical protein [Pseudarthrobacter enclensis]MDP9889314.1 hypothetical protein [Pseudarthrobacter enclensis]